MQNSSWEKSLLSYGQTYDYKFQWKLDIGNGDSKSFGSNCRIPCHIEARTQKGSVRGELMTNNNNNNNNNELYLSVNVFSITILIVDTLTN